MGGPVRGGAMPRWRGAMLDFDRYEYLTFDCYGTLIDWERGILTAIHLILANHGVTISDDELLERFGDLEAAAEQREYHSYKETLATVLDGFAQHYGFTLAPGER